jgi:chromosome partitioning protein
VIITVANVKGGVGKTTSAVLLAHALGGGVVDTDPQGSATAWGEAAAAAGTPLAITITSLPTARLAGRLPAGEHLVIDTPPGNLSITKAAVAVADLVLIPTAPTALDLHRVWATLDLTSEAGKPAAVLLVRVRAGTRALGASASALTDEGVRVIGTRIPLRESLALAWGDPVTDLHGYDLVAAELRRSAHG